MTREDESYLVQVLDGCGWVTLIDDIIPRFNALDKFRKNHPEKTYKMIRRKEIIEEEEIA